VFVKSQFSRAAHGIEQKRKSKIKTIDFIISDLAKLPKTCPDNSKLSQNEFEKRALDFI